MQRARDIERGRGIEGGRERDIDGGRARDIDGGRERDIEGGRESGGLEVSFYVKQTREVWQAIEGEGVGRKRLSVVEESPTAFIQVHVAIR